MNVNAYDFGQSSTFKLLVNRVTGSTFSLTSNEVKVRLQTRLPEAVNKG